MLSAYVEQKVLLRTGNPILMLPCVPDGVVLEESLFLSTTISLQVLDLGPQVLVLGPQVLPWPRTTSFVLVLSPHILVLGLQVLDLGPQVLFLGPQVLVLEPQVLGSNTGTRWPIHAVLDGCVPVPTGNVPRQIHLEKGVTVKVVFGIKDIDRSNVSAGHVWSEKVNLSQFDALLICLVTVLSLNVWLSNVHLLSNTFSLTAVILETFTTNTLLLLLWKTYLNKS